MRLNNDAKRRRDASNNMKNMDEILKNDIIEEPIKKYSDEEWKKIYEERFDNYMQKVLNKKENMKKQMMDNKKDKENLKEKKIICDKNIEKYEKIIQKNKEYIQNLKQNNDEIDEGRNKKRKYMTHTLNQRQVNQVNNLRIMTEENNILQRNNKPGETEEEIENLGNIELTNGNLIMEYLPNYNTNESRNKIKPKINIKKSPETPDEK